MPKSFTLDGKRYALDPQVPTGQIEWLVAREHVSEPDSAIIANIANRATGWPERLRKQAERYALKCHRDNQALFRRVMSGTHA